MIIVMKQERNDGIQHSLPTLAFNKICTSFFLDHDHERIQEGANSRS